MERDQDLILAEEMMVDFARRTGLGPGGGEPRRYLWTDAFAVCNFLELYRATGEDRHMEIGLRLVDQVHDVLGRHRRDDKRSGWISGLSPEEGRQHPTVGGLRIGKKLNEPPADGLVDPREEWDRDGQYLHYLTKWMHALAIVSEVTGDPRYLVWATELAASVQHKFAYTAPDGSRRMYWKMSIDLSRPLVRSMGQHDALDALMTYRQLQLAAKSHSETNMPDLREAIADAASMARPNHWVTDDPLGAGSLLIDAWRAAVMEDGSTTGLLRAIITAATASMRAVGGMDLGAPASRRLAFRELGLSIGLQAVEGPNAITVPGGADGKLAEQVNMLRRYSPLGREVKSFWSDSRSRESSLWREHEDINSAMLATTLAPGGFLRAWTSAGIPVSAVRER